MSFSCINVSGSLFHHNMAANSVPLTQIHEIIKCSICLETLKVAKVLPCIHTFCLQCLESYCDDKDPGEETTCPLCRKLFVIPARGIQSLPDNFFIQQLLQFNKATEAAGTQHTDQHASCELCSDSQGKITATSYCVECEEHMCDRCSVTHKKSKASSSHQIVYGQVIPSSKERIKVRGYYCDQHPNVQNNLFCYDCKVVICLKCVSKHNQHKLTDVSESADMFREQLNDDINKVSISGKITEDEFKKLETDAKRFIDKVNLTEIEITKKYDRVISVIQSQRGQVIEELHLFRSNILKKVETAKEEIGRQHVIMETFKVHCQALVEKGTACEISRMAHELHAKADEIGKTRSERDILSGVEVMFQPSSVTLTTNTVKNFTGEIVLNDRDIESVLSDIKKRNTERRLDNAQMQAFIEKLSSDRTRKLEELAEGLHLTIDINKNPLARSITLKGDPAAMTEVLDFIYSTMLDSQSKESDQKELETLGKSAQWEYSDGTRFHAFDGVTRGRIEKAYIEKKPTVEWKRNNKTYRITFKDNKEEIVGEGKTFTIRKFIPGSAELPHRWAPMPTDKTYLTVQINSTDEEYKKVIANLAQPTLAVQKIERIQNPTLYRQYMSCKKDMDNRNNAGAGSSNETRVWHGTAGVNVVNINSRNFNRSYCGAHGVAIGNGVYFATGSTYSIRGYCPPDAGTGLKYIYQARVLTGKTVTGAAGMKEPPNLPGRTDATYDSVTDNPAGPGMYVVFKDPQAYPEYLITFK